jgi:hypothetical protein
MGGTDARGVISLQPLIPPSVTFGLATLKPDKSLGQNASAAAAMRSLTTMNMIWLPLKLVLGGVTLAGFAALGFGLGTTAGLCSACCCAGPRRGKGSQAETATDRGTAGLGAKPARGAGRAEAADKEPPP